VTGAGSRESGPGPGFGPGSGTGSGTGTGWRAALRRIMTRGPRRASRSVLGRPPMGERTARRTRRGRMGCTGRRDSNLIQEARSRSTSRNTCVHGADALRAVAGDGATGSMPGFSPHRAGSSCGLRERPHAPPSTTSRSPHAGSSTYTPVCMSGMRRYPRASHAALHTNGTSGAGVWKNVEGRTLIGFEGM